MLVTGGTRPKQNQLRLAIKLSLLAPPELEAALAWLKPANQALFTHASFIWSTSTSPDKKHVFPNYQIEYYRIIELGLTF